MCVTPNQDIDLAIALSRRQDVLLATFGDMMRVPGSSSSLQKEKADGRRIRIVYTPLDALRLAKENPEHKVVFLAVGFETTSPAIATTLLKAHNEGIQNLYFLNTQNRVPPALRALLQSEKVQIHGFILPGHVCTILGRKPFEFISKEFKRPAVIAGFEPLDLLQAVWMLVTQIEKEQASVEIQYTRVVRDQGNPVAVDKMDQVFQQDEALWRGLGWIPGSGSRLKDTFSSMDAHRIEVDVTMCWKQSICLARPVASATRTWSSPRSAICASSKGCRRRASSRRSPCRCTPPMQSCAPDCCRMPRGIAPEDLVERAEAYARATSYPIQYQWTLIDGVNDSDAELERIVELLAGKYAIMNFIPFNSVDGLAYRRPSMERAAEMVRKLHQHGILAKLRQSAGQEVDAGCGQLRSRSIALRAA